MASLALLARQLNMFDTARPSSQTVPCCHGVRGFGERMPMRIQLAHPAELDAAIAICDDEIRLIDAAIMADRIPRPSALSEAQPEFVVKAERVAQMEDDLRPFRYPPANLMAARWSPSHFVKRLGARLNQWRCSGVAQKIAEMAPEHEQGDCPWPKISVVTVSFNQAPYLEASIRSVLDQNYPNLEYVVVDGGSTDGSVEIIERYRDRCHTVIIEPDRGQSDALNKGFAVATGEIMNWLCSDDLLEPGSLSEIGRAYARHGVDIIAGGCARIGETRAEEHCHHHSRLPLGETVRLSPLDILHFMRSWQTGNYFFQPEVFFSRRVWQASGAYIKEHLFYAMDYDLWLRMALAGATTLHIPVTIGCSRIHSAQKTQPDRKYLHQIRQLMKEYKALFESLRAGGPVPHPGERG